MKSSKRKIEPQAPIRDICKIAKALFGAQSAIGDCRMDNPVEQILENIHAEEETHASVQERRQRPRGLEAVIRVEGTADSEESRHLCRWGGDQWYEFVTRKIELPWRGGGGCCLCCESKFQSCGDMHTLNKYIGYIYVFFPLPSPARYTTTFTPPRRTTRRRGYSHRGCRAHCGSYWWLVESNNKPQGPAPLCSIGKSALADDPAHGCGQTHNFLIW